MNIQSYIYFTILGILVGGGIPYIYEKIIKFKCKQKNRELPDIKKSLAYKIAVVLITVGLYYLIALSEVGLLPQLLAGVIIALAIIITMVDNTIRLIPNEILLPLLLIGVIFRISIAGASGLASSLGAGAMMILLFGLTAKVAGFSKIGAGDIKLGFVIGIICGSTNLVPALLVMAATMGGFSVIGLLIGKLRRTDMIPFGGFMMAGLATGVINSLFSQGLMSLITKL